jgi:hypothetical protein
MLWIACVGGALVALPPSAPGQEQHGVDEVDAVDEIVAVVDSSPLLASDLELARLVELAPPDRVLTARVALELQFRELVSSGALYRLDMDTATAQATLRARLELPATDRSPLAGTGLTADDLAQLALRLAARDAFVEQRLRPRVRVTLEDVRSAYRDELVPSMESTNVPVPDLEAVAGQLREVLVERRLTEEAQQWMAEIRSRHEVVRYR